MEQALRAVKDRIVTMQVRPGERLDDIALSAELGLSRTPMREALFRLSSEGLVAAGPRGGFTVRPLELPDVSQLFEAHVVVARSTARLLAIRATEADVTALTEATGRVQAAIRRGSPAEIAASNADLHRLEAEAARNEHLKWLAWSIHDQGQRLAFLCFGGESREVGDLAAHFVRVEDDHDALLAAVVDHDPDAAEAVASRHVHLFRDRVLEFLSTDAVDAVELRDDVAAKG